MIHVCTPYDCGRNLGKAYNRAFQLIGEDDYLCVTDYDILFLLPDTIKHLHLYAEKYPDVDVFTCYANRSHVNSTQQLLGGKVSDNTDIIYHIEKAQEQTKHLYEIKEVTGNISGFLMMISKKVWNEVKFNEDMRCLGVDTLYGQKLRKNGKKVYRMEGIYCWHTYRLMNGVRDKKHLL